MTGHHIIDTPIQLAQCTRCKAYVFTCESSGIKTTADPTPLNTVEEIRSALIDGRAIYRIFRLGGKPHKLQRLTANSLAGKTGVVADHGCGRKAMNRSIVKPVAASPHQAPATLGGVSGGFPPPHALAGAQTATQGFCSATSKPPNPVTHATHHPSKRPDYVNYRCQRCRQLIGRTRNVIGIQLGERWRWAQHAEC